MIPISREIDVFDVLDLSKIAKKQFESRPPTINQISRLGNSKTEGRAQKVSKRIPQGGPQTLKNDIPEGLDRQLACKVPLATESVLQDPSPEDVLEWILDHLPCSPIWL